MKLFKNNNSLLLKQILGARGNVLSKEMLSRIERLVREKTKKIHHFEVLYLYEHFSKIQDEKAFRTLDNMFFPDRAESIIEPSFALACKRLHCLIKYGEPYVFWIDKVREILHESNLTTTDFKAVMRLNGLPNLENEKKFIELYSDVVSIIEEDPERIDFNNLVYFYKQINKATNHFTNFQSAKDKIESVFDENILNLQNHEIYQLFSLPKLKDKWIYEYFFRSSNSGKREYFFYMLYLFQNNDWTKWAFGQFGKSNIISKLPSSISEENKSFGIIERTFSRMFIKRPYIDEFFTFEYNKENKIRLSNPEESYSYYLLNVFYYLDSNYILSSIHDVKKVKEILEETKYINNQTFVFIYMLVKLMLCRFDDGSSLQSKIETKIQIFKEVNSLLSSVVEKNYIDAKLRMIPVKCYRSISKMEFEIYKTKEFKDFFETFTRIVAKIQKDSSVIREPIFISRINQIIEEYMNNEKPESHQNSIIYGELKPLLIENPDYEIKISKYVEINSRVSVNYFIKARKISLGREVKLVVDLVNKEGDWNRDEIHWKENYLSNWCGINYIRDYINIEDDENKEYFESERLLADINKLLS